MKRRLLSLMLAVCILLGTMPEGNVRAAEEYSAEPQLEESYLEEEPAEECAEDPNDEPEEALLQTEQAAADTVAASSQGARAEWAFAKFLKEKGYVASVDDENSQWIGANGVNGEVWAEKADEYTLQDIDQDGVPELLIRWNTTSAGWAFYALFSYDGEIHFLGNIYGYGGIRYSPSVQAICISCYRTTQTFANFEFYGFENNAMVWRGSVAKDSWNGLSSPYSVSTSEGTSLITEAEYQEYFADCEYLTYQKIADVVVPEEPTEPGGDIETDADAYIIEEVRKYTEGDLKAQYDEIMGADMSDNERLRYLNELFLNYGITDIKEGVYYTFDVSAHQRNFAFLTDNNCYTAYNFYDWLNTTSKGKAARYTLYVDGLIFNYEALSYLDPTTYTENDYPGIKKNKTLLKEIMEENNENLLTQSTAYSAQMASYLQNILELNCVDDYDMDELMDQIINCTSESKREKLQREFAEKVVYYIKINDRDKVYLDGDQFADALGYAAPIIELTDATVNDIVDMINMNETIELYKNNKKFLTTIYNSADVSWEMRMAAYYLLDDIENGYMNKVCSLLGNVFKFEKGVLTSKLVFDKTVAGMLMEQAGAATFGELVASTVGTVSFATFVCNIIIDTGDFVKQAAYTQGYAELSELYSKKLLEDKVRFREDESSENAWAFFEDYTILWNLRYSGEEQYVKMNEIKAFIFAKVPAKDYDMKKEVAESTEGILEECKFELAEGVDIPAGVQYQKKAVINCPVNVSVYAQNGKLIAKLKDGEESDIRNEYGRFSVIYQPYTGEYAKVICMAQDVPIKIIASAHDRGIVDCKVATYNSSQIMTLNKMKMFARERLEINSAEQETPTYRVLHDSVVNEEGTMIAVDANSYVKADRIDCDETFLEMEQGETQTVGISVFPENATSTVVDWISDDEDVAIVSNGTITAVGAGTAKIYAVLTDNINVQAEITISVTSGHKYNYYFTVDPTCMDYGYDLYICRCGDEQYQNYTNPLHPEGHDWTDWQLEHEPCYYFYGYYSRECRICGTWDSYNIDPKGSPFRDVAAGSYCDEAVRWAVDMDITKGKTATTFEPNQPCTRAQVITFLWRAAGSPEPESWENPFTDIKQNYAYQAILWGYEQGIVKGTTSTTFSPDKTITRAQAVTFLWRFWGWPDAESDACPFYDVTMDKYYSQAVLWAVENGITLGKTATTFAPDQSCTRGQIVTFLFRLLW